MIIQRSLIFKVFLFAAKVKGRRGEFLERQNRVPKDYLLFFRYFTLRKNFVKKESPNVSVIMHSKNVVP